MTGVSRGTRTVGLDKPCRVCGKPIHYTYAGPVEGVCGSCTDKRRVGGRVRPYHRGMVVGGRAPKRRSTASVVVLLALVIVGGGAAVVAVLRLLLG